MKTHLYSLLFCVLLILAASPVDAVLYPATGFSNDFYVYLNNPLEPEHYSGKLVIKFWNRYQIEKSTEAGILFVSDAPGLSINVARLNQTLEERNIQSVSRAFTHSAAHLKKERGNALMISGQDLPDMNRFFFIDAPDHTEALGLLWALYTNPVCEVVYMHPKPTPLPTPDLSDWQVYLHGAVSNGYDFKYAWTRPGGDGSQVRMIDIEYDWYEQHEDLQKTSADILYGYESNLFGNSRDHGTASVGVSAALNNGIGMKGGIYNADVKMISSLNSSAAWILHDAVNFAVSNTQPGDVILLEQQAYAQGAYCPIEYWALFYTPIANAAAQNRIIIEPAGNGSADLDDTGTWGTIFQRSTRDSMAIIVGAGNSVTRGRESVSTYGSRVDIQGWGDFVVATLGFGDLYGTGESNQYTKSLFAGTSSASALSAAAAGACESYARANYSIYLPPSTLRGLLASNGYAQTFGLAGHIGPLPNLSNTFSKIIPEPSSILFILFLPGIFLRKQISL
jgi:hypothetical protein